MREVIAVISSHFPQAASKGRLSLPTTGEECKPDQPCTKIPSEQHKFAQIVETAPDEQTQMRRALLLVYNIRIFYFTEWNSIIYLRSRNVPRRSSLQAARSRKCSWRGARENRDWGPSRSEFCPLVDSWGCAWLNCIDFIWNSSWLAWVLTWVG